MDMTIALTGKSVFIRTVTHYYTGRLASIDPAWLHLEDAAWIADTGRFADALQTGVLSEIEPYPGGCWISAGCVIDISEWRHELPRKQK